VKHDLVTTDAQFDDLCNFLGTARQIAFDTEFVSEDSFRPELCLIQVAADGRLAVIDPLKLRDLTPFWTALAAGDHETVVHAGRQEIEFSLRVVDKPPRRLFDVQIAAGMIGLEYPANYGTLVTKLLGVTPDKGETRTDWRRRPLSDRQIAYALADVLHLARLRDKLGQRLARLGRTEWFASEMADWVAEVEAASGRERWRKVSGSSGLAPRGLAIVRELWAWRESEAERRDCPVRRVLRDDLIVELARRRSVDPKQIRAIRGMERSDLARTIPDVAAAIGRALALLDSACPRVVRTDTNSQLSLLGQVLSAALASICRAAEVAPSIVGTAADVRELIAFMLAGAGAEPPLLARGWRALVVGNVLEDLLRGKLALRIQNPQSDHPLAIEPAQPQNPPRGD
jgi:ribonuclease D